MPSAAPPVSATDSASLRPLRIPPRLYIPMTLPRTSGATASAKAVGAIVRAGEPLTEDGPESAHTPVAPVAPVAGRIAGTARVRLTNGRETDAVVLETAAAEAAETASQTESPSPTAEQIGRMLGSLHAQEFGASVDRLRQAAVWADRWTSPDMLGQLQHCLRKPVDTVVCNLMDADPFLPVNRTCAQSRGGALVAGVAALARWTGAERVWAAVDYAQSTDRWRPVREVASLVAKELRIVPLENHYPQVDATLLIYTLLRRRLRPGRLPTEQGVLLFDAAAAVAVGEALLGAGPAAGAMVRVPLAVYEQPRDRTHLFSVPVGATVGDALAALDLPPAAQLDLRGGGPLREIRLTSACVIAGGELSVYACPREPDVNPDPCIRCGWCVEGCPVRIHPAGLLDAAQDDDLGLAYRYGLDACVECGVCSYVCPSHLPLLGGVRRLRALKGHA
jgi:Na+-translocating ferredoxin:NAD+ oxidoreductase subunit C